MKHNKLLFFALLIIISSAYKPNLNSNPERRHCLAGDRGQKCPIQTFAYMPVEGFTPEGNHKRYDSGCHACNDKSVVYYYNLVRCLPTCKKETKTVCAVSDSGSLIQNSDNCSACKVKGVSYYFRDSCPTPPRKNHVCTPQEKKANFCTMIYKPVCAKVMNKNKGYTSKTFSNGCVACSSPGVYSYFDGEC